MCCLYIHCEIILSLNIPQRGALQLLRGRLAEDSTGLAHATAESAPERPAAAFEHAHSGHFPGGRGQRSGQEGGGAGGTQ